VAIIMDGNGRWAKQRGLPRLAGHRAGTENIRRIVEASARFGVEYLTLYAFSTENWRRPRREVRGLIQILAEVIDRETEELHRSGVRLRHLGSLEGIAPELQHKIRRSLELTKDNTRLNLSIAFNYGGRAEIVEAVRRLVAEGVPPHQINEERISSYLYSAGLPDPDLIIRTGGEMRLSNFLLWQSAYSEYYATPTFWPDFDDKELEQALIAFGQRRRRFGRLQARAGSAPQAVSGVLRKRTLSAVIGIPPLVVVVWLGNPWFAMLVAAAALVATYELYRMLADSGRSPLTVPGLIGAVLFALIPLCPDARALPAALAAAIIVTLAGSALGASRSGRFPDWAWTLAGMLYIGWLLSYLVALAELENGWRWVLLTLFAVFASDTAAYFGGRAWGRHPLAPGISPAKTQEGTVAAFLGAILAVMVLPLILHLPIPWWQGLLLGLLVGLFSQLGDLAESAVKRSCGVKDAGGLIPGHGGVLDRLDSILFSGIVVYYYVSLIVL